ncbi:MAG TPA: L,D-transpeptidase family protein [Thermoanaerobaculia bacterium]
MHGAIRKTLVCLLAALATGGCNRADREVEAGIRERVASKQAPSFLQVVRWSLMQQVYQDRDYRPIWLRGGRPGGAARDLVRSICRSGEEGLRPADYDLAGLRTALASLDRKGGPEPADLAALDLRLTALLLGLGTDLLSGRLDPRTVDDGWYLRSRRSSVDSTLRAALLKEDSPDMLDELRPRQKEYGELLEALGDYRKILGDGGWAPVPAGKPLGRGDRGPRVRALRERLHASGGLGSGKESEVYDDDVAKAVAHFQIRHGMAPDSSVGPVTLSALNVPVEHRIRQIELNLDRYRWLPAEFADRYILVNIPDYHLYAYDGGKLRFEQRVIVGDEYQNATPVFADSMTYLVFRPEWNVPPSILVKEILPRLQEDDDYDLAAQGLELVDTAGRVVRDPSEIDWDDVDTSDLHYRVRQKPGPANALGRLKFMFPNRFNIYLHDTPSRKLFERSRRTLSHGCVRVEDPVQLAGFVLDGQDGWNEARVREETERRDGKGNRAVSLEEPVPVYLLYLTAFVRDGELHFRNDPYGKDRAALARIGKPALEEPAACEKLMP